MIAVTGLLPPSDSETRGFARGVSVFSSVSEEDDSVESTFVEEEGKLFGVVSALNSFVDVVVVVVVVVIVVVVVVVIFVVFVFFVFSLTQLTENCGSCCQLVVVLLLSKDATCH